MGSCRSFLIIEDNAGHRLLLEERIQEAFPDAQIESLSTLKEASERIVKQAWDLVVAAMNLPDGNVRNLLELLATHQPFTPIAVLAEEEVDEMDDPPGHHGGLEVIVKERKTLEALGGRLKRLLSLSQRMREIMGSGKRESTPVGFRDPVTDVYTRGYFEEALSRELSRANRYRQEFSILMADIDGFESLVRQGDTSGNFLLKKLAAILMKAVRAGDLVARYGPHEFVILLTHCRPLDGIRCASRVMNRLKGSRHHPFTISMGILHYIGESKISRIEQVLSHAQKALREAKAEGGNCYIMEA